ncbi:hypothetical protein ACGFZQ_43680 [Streptomyces sp. NPDC048254]|uniref:hypothetical protein n=1 Tax=Streptomyces sp. NPDC048254 TaxID=3365525 RepID=UPI00371D704F
MHRIVEVSLPGDPDLDDALAACATRDHRPRVPFWTLLFNNVILRLPGSDDFSAEAKRKAARDLTAAAAIGFLMAKVADL